MKVCKFGGSSLADAEQVGKVCDLIEADPDRRIVVVSAPGKAHPRDAKVTDLLIACAEAQLAGASTDAEVRAVLDRFTRIQEGCRLSAALTEGIVDDLRGRLAADPTHRQRFLDGVKAIGEDASAKLVAAVLQSRGHNAHYLSPLNAGLLLSDEWGNARLLPESHENLRKLAEADGITVFPGFFGFTRGGEVVTFPRGGSDITGSILAAAVRASVYENFTDVDSVLAADPRLVPEARPIPELTYREMRELSYAGFNVLHDEAIVPAVHAGVPIWIRNTNHPEAPGTRIVPERDDEACHVVGIASGTRFCTIIVSKYLMNREIGFGRRLLQILEDESLSYEHAPSGIDSMSVILREDALDSGTEERVLHRIRKDLGADDVGIEHGLALIMIVGEGMRYCVGQAATATQAMADAGVNIEMMNQGSSEISMMFGVKADDCERAVRSLYHAFF